MITVKWKVSGFFVDKPIERVLELKESTKAMQSPQGDVMTIGQLNNTMLEHYVSEKYIDNTSDRGKLLGLIEIERN